jgi:hypothetical protein
MCDHKTQQYPRITRPYTHSIPATTSTQDRARCCLHGTVGVRVELGCAYNHTFTHTPHRSQPGSRTVSRGTGVGPTAAQSSTWGSGHGTWTGAGASKARTWKAQSHKSGRNATRARHTRLSARILKARSCKVVSGRAYRGSSSVTAALMCRGPSAVGDVKGATRRARARCWRQAARCMGWGQRGGGDSRVKCKQERSWCGRMTRRCQASGQAVNLSVCTCAASEHGHTGTSAGRVWHGPVSNLSMTPFGVNTMTHLLRMVSRQQLRHGCLCPLHRLACPALPVVRTVHLQGAGRHRVRATGYRTRSRATSAPSNSRRVNGTLRVALSR